MRVPSATYRIQFNSSFGFEAAGRIAAYLEGLGVEAVYASPIFKARRGSTHGYDVIDPNLINPEIGSDGRFRALAGDLGRRGIGWVQDFVPNHMAYDSGNRMLMDIFEKGPSSPYFGFFDVVWDHLRENLRGKLIAPFLGGPYGETLEKGELSLQYGEDGFSIRYYETSYPVRIESYADILSHRGEVLRGRLGEEHADLLKLLGAVEVLRHLRCEQGGDEGRGLRIRMIKELIKELYERNPAVRDFVNENVSSINEDRDLLDRLVLRQWFRFTFWRVATKEINYQRFFNINDLISLRMEDEAVFDSVHRQLLALVGEGLITGLRIDHVDGLYDPTEYLRRLRARAEEAYIVVEKILELAEQLPARWPVEGTTGYEFMNYVNGLFVDPRGKQRIHDVYAGFTGESFDYEELLYEKKKLMIERHLTGDLDNLTYVLKKISITTRHGIDLTWIGLKTALAELAAVFPVYRTYVDGDEIDEHDRRYNQEALEKARAKNPDLARELDFIEAVLWMRFPEHLAEENRGLWISFVMRFQQFTSPLMAKGLEDTTFYIFNRLVSLNEVGGNPEHFGVTPVDFHESNRVRAERHPHTMNATATHDTKRGEDVRTRIDVLAELPGEWGEMLESWWAANRGFKKMIEGEEAPDKNREYFLYQTLVGAFPFDQEVTAEFVERIKSYMVKAAREAKLHTFWQDPDREYEQAIVDFVEQVLRPSPSNGFLKSFAPFQKKIAHFGVFNSLSQLLLKIASPGLPDFYQGSELWDLSLVDPDNRRSVDYAKRESLLRELKQRARAGGLALVAELLSTKEDGRVKLFTMYKALEARKRHRQLFEASSYVPLTVTGRHDNHVVAFARQSGHGRAVVVVPRLLTSVIKPGALPLGAGVWEDTSVELPEGAGAVWHNVFTHQTVDAAKSVAVAEAFKHFPIALLIGE
jgi:(1->4)-alpha-D-glucan 1-alpha-D-glucosylmutase